MCISWANKGLNSKGHVLKPTFHFLQANFLVFPYLLSTEFSYSLISIEIFKFLLRNALWLYFPLRIHLGNDDDGYDSTTEYCCALKTGTIIETHGKPQKPR